jgi:hypothetical protein
MAVVAAKVTSTPSSPVAPICSSRGVSGGAEHRGDEEPVVGGDRAERVTDPWRLELPRERIREDEGAYGAEREPGERDEPDDEHEHEAPVARLERLGRRLGGGGTHAELACGRLEAPGVVLAPAGQHRREHEPERDEPEEDAEGDSAGEQAATELSARA